jgi:hypothetical protein
MDNPLTLIVRDEAGHIVQVVSTVPLAVAEKRPLNATRLAGQQPAGRNAVVTGRT